MAKAAVSCGFIGKFTEKLNILILIFFKEIIFII